MTEEENRLLSQTGPNTPMGHLYRSYWLPALLASELLEPGGAPVRVTLLSEKLLAFRNSDGELGLIDEFCAHRGVSLWFGRNEEGGIRCPYHGWNYATNGQCMEVPSESKDSGFAEKIKLTSYPLKEQGGILWAYLGPLDQMPAMPAYEWSTVPDSHRHITKRLQACNALQAMEGGLDSFHSSFLHRMSVGEDPLLKRDPTSAALLKGDPHPQFMPMDSPGGLYITTRRNVEPNSYYWRVTHWLMPCFNLFPPYEGNPYGAHAWVPIDDHQSWTFSIDYRPDRALTQEEVNAMEAGMGIHSKNIPNSFIPVANASNDYLMDRQAQKRKETFSGVLGIAEQDAAVQESMGTISRRELEHLVGTDNGIIMTRKKLLRAAQSLDQGVKPPGLDPSAQSVRAYSRVIPRDQPLTPES
jgi:phenylpropionate dioxygenase-like ring-hydroxylating dioxygenase large terminal subunit